jgi:hypothetical protein
MHLETVGCARCFERFSKSKEPGGDGYNVRSIEYVTRQFSERRTSKVQNFPHSIG